LLFYHLYKWTQVFLAHAALKCYKQIILELLMCQIIWFLVMFCEGISVNIDILLDVLSNKYLDHIFTCMLFLLYTIGSQTYLTINLELWDTVVSQVYIL
jgi:hypothetical protein